MAGHDDEYERVMGSRPPPDEFSFYRADLRVTGCLVLLAALLFLTGFALQWVARH